MKPIDAITEAIIGDAISVHRQFGPGLLESTYEACLAALLSRRGMTVARQLAMPVVFEGERLDRTPRPPTVLPARHHLRQPAGSVAELPQMMPGGVPRGTA